ncbi:MAG: lipoprotein [Rhizomicrobium sp.]
MNSLLRTHVLLLSLSAVILSGCGQKGMSGDVLAESKRADGNVRAIVTRYDGGATVSFVYRVYIQDGSGEANEVLRADHVVGLSTIWSGDILQIAMQCGRIFSFSNFSDVLDGSGNLKEVIPIKLQVNGLCSSSEYSAGQALARRY